MCSYKPIQINLAILSNTYQYRQIQTNTYQYLQYILLLTNMYKYRPVHTIHTNTYHTSNTDQYRSINTNTYKDIPINTYHTYKCLPIQVSQCIELEAVGLQFEPYRWRPCGVTWDSSRTVVVIKLLRTSALSTVQYIQIQTHTDKYLPIRIIHIITYQYLHIQASTYYTYQYIPIHPIQVNID